MWIVLVHMFQEMSWVQKKKKKKPPLLAVALIGDDREVSDHEMRPTIHNSLDCQNNVMLLTL